MKAVVLCLSAVASLLLSAAAVLQENPTPIDAETAKKFGKIFAEHAAKLDKQQIKIDADAELSNGMHVPDKLGLLLVPQRGLKEGEELAAKFKTDKGAPLAYLFMFHLVPVIDGQPVDVSRVRSVKFVDDNGGEHTIYTLLLSVRQVAEDEYRLYCYGHEDKPLVDAKFSQGTGPGTEPAVVEIKDPNEQTRQGKLVITIFNKYQASFTIGHRAD